MTLVFTICSNNYLAQAHTLGDSLLQYNPDYKFVIGLVDKKNEGFDYTKIPFDILEVEKIGITCFDEMFKRYNITELNTAVKPFYFEYFLKKDSASSNFIYLDPDICVYHSFHELENQLECNEIIIVPHITQPIEDDFIPTENNILNAGLYNLGFIAIKRSEEAKQFIKWWSSRLENKAYVDFSNGMFTDQLWINLVPLFFKKVFVLKHPGYNMAYWNLHERYLNIKNEVINENYLYPLVFFHFSGFDPLKINIISKYQSRFTFENRHDIADLFKEYANILFRNGVEQIVQYPCFYSLEKTKIESDRYVAYKKLIPLYKRLIRGIILRIISIFKVNVDYYTH